MGSLFLFLHVPEVLRADVDAFSGCCVVLTLVLFAVIPGFALMVAAMRGSGRTLMRTRRCRWRGRQRERGGRGDREREREREGEMQGEGREDGKRE